MTYHLDAQGHVTSSTEWKRFRGQRCRISDDRNGSDYVLIQFEQGQHTALVARKEVFDA